jgi:O-antigen/teichoic acid export membrane protein
VARILGAAEYGKFSFALAFISFFVVFNDLGLSTIIMRDFGGGANREKEFSSIISLKILLSLGSFFLILLSSFFITHDSQIRNIILTLAVFSLVNGFIATFYALFSAHQKLEYRALIETSQGAMIVGIGLFILFKFPSVENLSYSYLSASLVTLAFVLIFYHFKLFPFKISWETSVWKKFLLLSWPLALTSLFGTIYSYTDSVMLGYLGFNTQNGWYNAAYRVVTVASIPFGLVSGSFYPALSVAFRESKESLQKIWDYQLDILIFLITPLALGGIILAPKIINFLYSESYAPAAFVLQILMVMVWLISVSRPFYDILIVSNRQGKTFLFTVAGALFNVFFNILLIPKYNFYGAAVASVITCAIVLIISAWLTKVYTPIKIPYLKFIFSFFLSGISCAVMYFLITRPVIYNGNLILCVLVGGAAYFLAFFIFKKIARILSLQKRLGISNSNF